MSFTDPWGHRDRKPQVDRVVFYKELTISGSGQPRRVALMVVHITGRHARKEVEATALRKFERDRGVSCWKNVADAYEVFKPE